MNQNHKPQVTKKMKFTIPILSLLIFLSISLNAQFCNEGESLFKVEILTDKFPNETSWALSIDNETTIASGNMNGVGQYSLYEDSLCVSLEDCLYFTIYDSFGDGICCSTQNGNGYYRIFYNDSLVAQGGNFANQDQQLVNCPLGIACDNPIPIALEDTYIADKPDTWYTFTPDTTGLFTIATCDLNLCNTSVWIYEYCLEGEIDDSPEGAIVYANTGCITNDELAQLAVNLMAGTTYYIRIGDDENACGESPIIWSIEYNGPPTGCIDQSACNYNPIALVDDGSCLDIDDPNCPEGPDLVVLDYIIENTLILQKVENDNPCFIEEQCMTGYGMRELLRFTTHIENIGEQDFYIGVPPVFEGDAAGSDWEWDPCHQHWHYEGYAEYILYDQEFNELPIGFKNGFCVLDLNCSLGGGVAKYTCANQGISAGCGDIYGFGLDCQWIDITDVPNGIYTLVVRVNWDKSPDANGVLETNYFNNWAQVCIHIQADALGSRYIQVVEECEPYVDCAGEIYGDSQIDCQGICGGPNQRGDLNKNFVLDSLDLQQYLNGILIGEETNACNDLHQDNEWNIVDAVLLNECLIQNDAVVNGPCNFPYNVVNINDTTTFVIDDSNIANQYLDVYIKNADNYLLAFQMSVGGGVRIDSIEWTYPNIENYDFEMDHNFSIIYGMIKDGVPLPKSNVFVPLFRIYLKEGNYENICLTCPAISVNNFREKVVTVVE